MGKTVQRPRNFRSGGGSIRSTLVGVVEEYWETVEGKMGLREGPSVSRRRQ